jgi:hypothetical protein
MGRLSKLVDLNDFMDTIQIIIARYKVLDLLTIIIIRLG